MYLTTIIIGAICLILGLVAGTLFAKSSLNLKLNSSKMLKKRRKHYRKRECKG